MPDQAAPDRAGEKSTTEEKAASSASSDDSTNVIDLLVILAKRKRVVLGVPVAAGAAAVVATLLMSNIYTGTTRILPPQQSASTASALLSQLGGVLGSFGGAAGGALGVRNPNDLYVGMLRSRTVADNLVKRFDLNKVYDQDLQTKTRTLLESNTGISVGKEGIITIGVDDKNPKRAADLANAYVDELMKLTKVLAVTEASQRRLFFERQLLQAKDNLTAAEIVARQAIQKGGLAQVDAQGRSMIEVTARLRAQISAKEVQLGAMRTFAAEGNPELQRTQEELQALRRELGRIEGSNAGTGPASSSEGRNTGLDNLGRLRDVKYFEFLYELLAKQYEVAKIDEARDATIIQVMDEAVVPEIKTRPKRAVICIVVTLAAAFLAVMWVLVSEIFGNLGADPRNAEKLGLVRRYLRP